MEKVENITGFSFVLDPTFDLIQLELSATSRLSCNFRFIFVHKSLNYVSDQLLIQFCPNEQLHGPKESKTHTNTIVFWI
jgi:hypothetical protein